jgi:predicted esterase
MSTTSPPYILPPLNSSPPNPATFIFLHGYGDDAEGLPLGLAQQFQFHKKLPHLKWILPNAPQDRDSGGRAWYAPKPLGGGAKPRIPGHEQDGAEKEWDDDEEGILRSVDEIDRIVADEVAAGTDRKRIVVGGFSQGCAIALNWGLIGKKRDVVGVVCVAGYFPLADNITRYRKERGIEGGRDDGAKKWFYVHGSKDILVPGRLFEQGKRRLGEWVEESDVETKLYEGMGHATNNAMLRDLLGFLSRVVPE